MRAMIHLEARHLAAMMPVVGIMLIFGMAPIFIQQEQGATVGVAFLAMTSVVLVSRLFPFEPASTRANTLVGTLPVTRRQVIASRYALALLIILASALLAMLVVFRVGLPERIGVAVVVATLPLLNLVAIGPLSSRGSLGQLGPMMPILPFVALMLLVLFMPDTWKQAALAAFLQSPALSVGACAAVLIGLVIASFLLSTRWFTKRDL